MSPSPLFKVQTETEQQVWNDCARLIANAVIYYNTALLSKVYEQKVAAGDLDAIAFIQGMSPVAWQHVNMFGSFEFSDEPPDIDMEALAARYADSVVSGTTPANQDNSTFLTKFHSALQMESPTEAHRFRFMGRCLKMTPFWTTSNLPVQRKL